MKRVRPIIEGIGGFLLGVLLSPWSPIEHFYPWRQIVTLFPDLLISTVAMVVELTLVSILLPLIIYLRWRTRSPSFARGLLVSVCAINIPSYVMTAFTLLIIIYCQTHKVACRTP